MQNQKNIAIIGAGVAGISAAVEAAKSGARVLLFEATEHLGGRARSFTDRATGEIIDNGQHVMMGCYTSLLSILREIGTEKFLFEQDALKVSFIDKNGEKDLLDASLLPGKFGVALGILRLKKISFYSKIRALRLAAKIQFLKNFSRPISAQKFLEENFQTEEAITQLWEPIILATLNSTPQNAAASLFVEVLRRAFFGGKNSSSLLIPQHGLSELFAPFPEWLERHGGKIFLRTGVEKILFDGEKISGLVTDKGEEIFCDALISAIPPRALLRILPEKFREDKIPGEKFSSVLEKYKFSPIVSVYLWFDKNFLDEEFTAMIGTETQWIFNRRKLAGAPAFVKEKFPGHLALTVSAGDSLVDTNPEQIALLCLEEISSVIPAARGANLLAWKVIKEKSATFLATPELEPLRPAAHTPVENFFLAGDWTATKLPATLEGAAQSGIFAARLAAGQILCYSRAGGNP